MFAEDRAAGNTEPIWAEDGKAGGSGCLRPLKPSSGYCGVPQMLDVELQDLMFALLTSGLLWSNLVFLLSHSSLVEWECLFYATVSWK